jgi:galactan 5-O-arabinofuranosyltransferase
MGSSIADRYMPRNDDSVGMLAYVSQMVRQPDGRCPAFSAPDRCVDSTEDLMNGIIRGGAADVPLRRAESG